MLFPAINNSFTYRTISGPAKAELREKGSRFLAFAFPVQDEEAIKNHLDDLREKYPDATHHCYAWVLGAEGEQYRANDDGEPGNSAGKPIHRQILSANLTFVLVVVVRYFGGTKLGIPGLIHSYGKAAEEVLKQVSVIENELTISAIIVGNAGEEHQIFVAVNRLGGTVDVLEMTHRFRLRCTIPKSRADEFMAVSKLWHRFETEISE